MVDVGEGKCIPTKRDPIGLSAVFAVVAIVHRVG